MSNFANTENGVAPFMEEIDVSSSNVTPTGTCIGFYVEGAGVVAFESNGNTITLTVAATSYHTVQVSQFNNSGTTATGIHALYL